MAQLDAVFEDKELSKYLDNIISRRKSITARDRKYMDGVATIVDADIQMHFVSESGPDGKWKDRSKRYKDFLRKLGKSEKILQISGDLKRGFIPSHYRLQSDGVIFFNIVEYSRIHDEGLSGMPKRQFMWLSDAAFNRISQHTLDFLSKD